MNLATKKWIFTKASSVILLPLMLWFILSFVSIYDQGYSEILNFFIIPINKFLFSLFIIFAFFFSSLTISEVFEDYIDDKKLKNVANKLLYLSAIIIPVSTLFILFRLSL